MAITFETVKSHMPAIGLSNYKSTEINEKNGRILAAASFKTEDEDYKDVSVGISISLQEDGEYLQIRLFNIIDNDIKIIESPYLKEFLLYVMKLNYSTKIGRWCLDEDDGDFYIDWSIGIEDNETLTESQVSRVMNALVGSVRRAYAPLHRILKTGSAAPPRSRDDLTKDILFMLMQHNAFDLVKAIKDIQDVGSLAKIEALLKNNNFDGARSLIESHNP